MLRSGSGGGEDDDDDDDEDDDDDDDGESGGGNEAGGGGGRAPRRHTMNLRCTCANTASERNAARENSIDPGRKFCHNTTHTHTHTHTSDGRVEIKNA